MGHFNSDIPQEIQHLWDCPAYKHTHNTLNILVEQEQAAYAAEAHILLPYPQHIDFNHWENGIY